MIQEQPVSTDDLSLYKGLWVAIRDGRVVDSADNVTDLRASDLVEQSDFLLLVPRQSSSAVFL
jgi:hypothetical protein